jgi:uncharacterized protein involved in outer membrane biogenesis
MLVRLGFSLIFRLAIFMLSLVVTAIFDATELRPTSIHQAPTDLGFVVSHPGDVPWLKDSFVVVTVHHPCSGPPPLNSV